MPNIESQVAKERARRGNAQRLLGTDKRKRKARDTGKAVKRAGEKLSKTKLGKGAGMGLKFLSELFLDK